MKVGIVGWRGMVGSVLLERMEAEGDFESIEATFFSTSNSGAKTPLIAGRHHDLADAYDISALVDQDVILTCQGGEYTSKVYGAVREAGWQGYWIDAASTLRLDPEAVIVLDPVNGKEIREALDQGVKTYVGGNCTVSLMLMALG